MRDLTEEYKEHFEMYKKIVDSVNETSRLINELGKMPITGVRDIDNIYHALYEAQTKVVEIFEEEKGDE